MKITLTGLKQWMKANEISVVDMNWAMLNDHGFSMLGLLKWELRGYKGSAKINPKQSEVK